MARLKAQPPRLAVIEALRVESCGALKNYAGFTIRASEKSGENNTLVSPDVGICEDCLRELRDPRDRRYRYPFINCTNCGPRFTIIRDVPYDRPLTSMGTLKTVATTHSPTAVGCAGPGCPIWMPPATRWRGTPSP